MKRKTSIFIASLALLALSTNLSAQQYSYGGAVLDHDIMMPSDFAQLSQSQVFGTARSMAMGGAFTSLGADLSATVINPAGLGMYTHEVFSISPMISSADSSTAGASSWQGNNKTAFSMSNLGATFNVMQRPSGSLIAINAAVNYTRTADYNTRMSFSSESLYDSSTGDLVPSIIDIYAMQLAGASIYPSSDGSMDYDANPYYWPAQGAYGAYLLDPTEGDSGWGSNVIGTDASVLSSYMVEQQGRADEYSFAVGANCGNFLYLGATFGVQSIHQTTEYTYQEEYGYEDGYAYSGGDNPIDYQAAYANIWQKVKLNGSGVNLKLGAILRPTRALRIGVAYHTPTYYSLVRTYQSSVESTLLGNYTDLTASKRYISTSPEIVDSYEYSWNFSTAPKFLTGLSLQVGNFGIISADYERQWYNKMRVTNNPGDFTNAEYKEMFQSYYKPVDTFRFGMEVKPVPNVALRVGGGVSSSMIEDSTTINTQMADGNHYITCGFGYQFNSSVSLDFAYQLLCQDYTSYKLFYALEDGESVLSSDKFNTTSSSNYFVATLCFRL